MTKIKLCGLRRECDIMYVNELLPDYIGFIFAEKSKRFVSVKEAEKLGKKLDERIIPVGVFVDAPIDFIASIVDREIIRAVQLHGKEDNQYIKELRKKVDCTILKAFRIDSESDVKAAAESLADYVLLDSGAGTGETFDWSLINNIKRDYFLAGGLTPENVSEAIKTLHPFGVDASSSLEKDGYKDKDKMEAFVKAVLSVDNKKCWQVL